MGKVMGLVFTLALAASFLQFAMTRQLSAQEGKGVEAKAGVEAASIESELKKAQSLADEGRYQEAIPHFRRILELASQKHELSAQEYFALGIAHMHLMADAFDKAIKSGVLEPKIAEICQRWRDNIWKKAAPVAEAVKRVQVISHGEEVDIASYVVKGKITIFDFYSEYCPPCRRIAPLLEKLAEKRDDIVVIKVDINRPGVRGIDWESPVARQYRLQSIPHFKIYGLDGKLQMEGDRAYEQVLRWIKEAGISG